MSTWQAIIFIDKHPEEVAGELTSIDFIK